MIFLEKDFRSGESSISLQRVSSEEITEKNGLFLLPRIRNARFRYRKAKKGQIQMCVPKKQPSGIYGGEIWQKHV